MAELKLYNTLSRKKETFKPLSKKEVGIYTCGPTVYWFQHIGNLRTYIFSDILKRTLKYNNYKVKHVMNITDVGHLTSDADEGEDKIEKAAEKEKKSAQKIAEYYLKIFRQDLKKLNIQEPTIWCSASKHIKEQIELIKKLGKKGFAYKTSDGIYFNSAKFRSYGKFAHLNPEQMRGGKRISLGEKKNKTDFALWKFSPPDKKRQQEWDSPWGKGFPGWHIECSAMSMKYLGETFDIHTGGEDHVSVHHTNEIAQSEAATGKKFVNFWLHGAFLLNKGQKVSKSTGGLYTVSELEKMNYPPVAFRYLCLQTSYKKPLNFSLENLDAAKAACEKIKRKIIELQKIKHKGKNLTANYEKKFLAAINDNLNTPKALDIFIKTINDANFDTKLKLALLEKFDTVLALGVKQMKEEKISIPKEIQDLINEREKLRKDKLWEEADLLRQSIREKGFLIEDKPEGSVISKIN